jgi:hypothetical protein
MEESSFMNRTVLIPILLAAMWAWAAPAQAQEGIEAQGEVKPSKDFDAETGTEGPGDAAALAGLQVRVIPRFGLLAPDSYFYEEFTNFSGDGFVEWTTGSLGRAAFVGLGVEVGFANGGLLLRGEVARSFEGWLSAVHGILIPRTLFNPPEVVNTWFDVPASITFLSLQAVLPTRLGFWGIQPYVLAGFTGKWYSFGSPTTENTVGAILPSNGFTPSAEVGGGFTLGIFGLTFDAQVKDNINRYWDKTQHDLVVSGGLIWRVR